MIVVLIFSVCMFITVKYLLSRKHSQPSFKSFHEIPCPGAFPVVGNIKDMFCREDEIWKIIRNRALEHFPIYRSKIFNRNVVSFLHPEDIQMILSSTEYTAKGILYETFGNLTGNGLIVNKGRLWQQRRKLLTKNFHFSVLQNYIELFNREVDVLVSQLQKQINTSIDILEPITRSSMKIINEAIVGKDLKMLESDVRNVVSALDTISEIIGYRSAKPFINLVYNFSKMKQKEEKALNVIHSFSSNLIESLIQERNHNTSTVLDLMINAPAIYDKKGIKDEIDTFLFAGNSTTSAGSTFALLALANHPSYQDEVYQELVEIVGPDGSPSYSDLTSMSFLDRFLKECLRLFPPAPIIGRETKVEMITKTGYKIPAGTQIIFHIFDIHRNPNVFENPEKFDPDRFLPENVKRRHPFSFIPFSAGSRNCIAQKFAMLEIKAKICGILKNFKLEPITLMEEMVFIPDVTLRTKETIKVKLVRRS